MTDNTAPIHSDSEPPSKKERIVKIISTMIDKVEKAGGLSRESIFMELVELKNIIEESRKEIGLARAGDIREKDIPTATDELDAVVEATAAATSSIMDSCDIIQQKVSEIEGPQTAAINDEIMKIYEACSFQDITGQRIRKVVKTLVNIEDRVEKLLSVLGDKTISRIGQVVEESRPKGDEALLNGPQLPGQGVSQDEIDRLLAELDGN